MKQVQIQEQEQQKNRPGAEVRPDDSRRSPSSEEAQPGKFPKLTTTLRAEVLATMLAGDDMTGVESVFSTGSTKLATVMRALTRRYRWPIERREFAMNAAGGQVVWISMYVIPAAAIVSAFSAGAEAWIAEVREARSNRLAASARRSASSLFGSNEDEQVQLRRIEL